MTTSRLRLDLTRRQYATILAFAKDNKTDFHGALEAIWLLCYQEIENDYDPVQKRVTKL